MFGFIPDWLGWTTGFGLVGYAGLALFAPHVLSILAPIGKAIVEGAIELCKSLWRGFKWTLGSVDGMIFTGAVFALGWSLHTCEPTVIYKDKPSVSQKGKATSKSTETDNIFRDWFGH